VSIILIVEEIIIFSKGMYTLSSIVPSGFLSNPSENKATEPSPPDVAHQLKIGWFRELNNR
jgi:hypothetical protein